VPAAVPASLPARLEQARVAGWLAARAQRPCVTLAAQKAHTRPRQLTVPRPDSYNSKAILVLVPTYGDQQSISTKLILNEERINCLRRRSITQAAPFLQFYPRQRQGTLHQLLHPFHRPNGSQQINCGCSDAALVAHFDIDRRQDVDSRPAHDAESSSQEGGSGAPSWLE
jgi:hypothetical protein